MKSSGEQVIKGLVTYIEQEILPAIKGFQQISLGIAVSFIQRKSTEVFADLKKNKLVQSLGLISDDGLIDVDTLLSSVIDSMNKYSGGRLEVDGGALFGKFSFSEPDLHKIHGYIAG